METDDRIKDICNYCAASYVHSGGYGNLDKHMRREHKKELGIDESQTQLSSRYGKSSGPNSSSQLFKKILSNFKEHFKNNVNFHF